MARYLTLALFLFFVIGGGTLIGASSPPGEWYAALEKPAFQPPGWLFGPVWTVLYILIAIAGWRTWQRRAEGPAMQVWFAQMAVNFIWSPAFFVMHLRLHFLHCKRKWILLKLLDLLRNVKGDPR